jgi:hypothetical protein
MLPFVLALVALFLPAWSVQQTVYLASFGVALVVLGTYGGVFARKALRVTSTGPWTAVYLGQFAVLAVLTVLMPLNGLAARWIGASLPLIWLVVPPALVLVLATFRRPPSSPPVLLFLFGLAASAVVVAVYSQHLSALGLDLHEHITWIRQIVSRGYVPVAEPGTRIVGNYPRTFHVVTALWNAAGLGLPAGPFAKAMPFIQNALPLLSVAEQLVAARPQTSRTKLEVTLGLAFFLYAFLVVPMAYPTPDLFGTPRFSSNSLLLLPLVLFLVAHACRSARASALAIATAPLVAAWALTWNPILPVLLAVVIVPTISTFLVVLRPPRAREVPARLRATLTLACGALAMLGLAQDPWFVGLAAQRSAAVRALVHRSGLLTFQEAVAEGLATPRETLARTAPAAPPCPDAACLLGKAAEAGRHALSAPWTSAAAALSDASRLLRDPSLANERDAFKGAFVIQPSRIADYAALPLFLWIAAGVVLAAWRSMRQRVIDADGKLLLASLVGVVASGVMLAFAASLAAALSDQRHESTIFAGYLGLSGAHVTVGLLWLPFAGATLVLTRPLIDRRADAEGAVLSRSRRVAAALGLAAWLALPLTARLNLHWPLKHHGFWSWIGMHDVRALREVEKAIPPEDGVIIPAEHAIIGQWEHWVLPLGETAALLPYGERRYLFNVYLGASYPLSWRDLTDRLCSEDPVVRAAFFERMHARWLLVRDFGGDAAAVVNRRWREMCGVSFAELGAELPAVREVDGIFLFRLRAQELEAKRPAR